MTKAERQDLTSAYKNLASAIPTIRNYMEGERRARSITEEDYEVLKPFLFAEYERVYKVGDGSIKVEGNISTYFVEVITSEGRDLLFVNERQEMEFFVFICDMITAVLSPIFNKVKSDILYADKKESNNGSNEDN